MNAYLLRLNVTASAVPYTLIVRDDCYRGKIILPISANPISFLYRAKSRRVTLIAIRGSQVVSRSLCLTNGCNRSTLNLTFAGSPMPSPITRYNLTLTDRNYGIPLDGTLIFSN